MPRVVQVLSILSSLKSNYSQDCASSGCCSFQISFCFVLSSLSLQIHSLAFIQSLNWRYSLETLWAFPKFPLCTSAPSLILCPTNSVFLKSFDSALSSSQWCCCVCSEFSFMPWSGKWTMQKARKLAGLISFAYLISWIRVQYGVLSNILKV